VVLVDTSVWVEHLRKASPLLQELLESQEVVVHTFVIGELACGHLPDRPAVLGNLSLLPRADAATDDEALHLIETGGLYGAGLGYIDVHLLASALLSNSLFWTRDKRLHKAAVQLGLAWSPNAKN